MSKFSHPKKKDTFRNQNRGLNRHRFAAPTPFEQEEDEGTDEGTEPAATEPKAKKPKAKKQ